MPDLRDKMAAALEYYGWPNPSTCADVILSRCPDLRLAWALLGLAEGGIGEEASLRIALTAARGLVLADDYEAQASS